MKTTETKLTKISNIVSQNVIFNGDLTVQTIATK